MLWEGCWLVEVPIMPGPMRAILDSLREISVLPPGLDEMKIDRPTTNSDCHEGAYAVRFEERQVENIRSPVDRPAFERIGMVYQLLDTVYTNTLSPWVQAAGTPIAAAMLEWFHPMRLGRHMFGSSCVPMTLDVRALAAAIRKDRHRVSGMESCRQQAVVPLGERRHHADEERSLRRRRSHRAVPCDAAKDAPESLVGGRLQCHCLPIAADVLYPFLLGPSIAALAMSGSSALVAINAPMLKRTKLTGIREPGATASAPTPISAQAMS